MLSATESADGIYELEPEQRTLWPTCTVYLVAGDKMALVETGPPVQARDIMVTVRKLGCDLNELTTIMPTHIHLDHAGGAGVLAQQLAWAKVVTHERTVRFLSEPSLLSRLAQGFAHVFGDDAVARFGAMVPIAEDRLVPVTDGESISLGDRELRVIHTPGHNPYHLCFWDTKTRGLFCGDALGQYLAEQGMLVPLSVPGFDPDAALQSIDRLRQLNPGLLFFSHHGVSREATRLLQLAADNIRESLDIMLRALRAGESQQGMAHRLADFLARDSPSGRAQLSAFPRFIPLAVEGYVQYFKHKGML